MIEKTGLSWRGSSMNLVIITITIIFDFVFSFQNILKSIFFGYYFNQLIDLIFSKNFRSIKILWLYTYILYNWSTYNRIVECKICKCHQVKLCIFMSHLIAKIMVSVSYFQRFDFLFQLKKVLIFEPVMLFVSRTLLYFTTVNVKPSENTDNCRTYKVFRRF